MKSAKPSIANPGGNRPILTLVPRVPRGWRSQPGDLREYRAAIEFDPYAVRIGSSIGNLTVMSAPVVRENRIHGWPCRCTWGIPPTDREGYARLCHDLNPALYPAWPEGDKYPPPCATVYSTVHADMKCVCGKELTGVKITGDSSQRISCGCHMRSSANRAESKVA